MMRDDIQPRALPWSCEAEQAVLGGLMLDPDAFARMSEVPLQAGHFFDSRHRDIWTAIAGLQARREPVDMVTVHLALKSAAKVEECGGRAYLNALCESIASARSIATYAGIVLDKAQQRDLCAAVAEAMRIAQGTGTAAEKIDAAAAAIGAVQRPAGNAGPHSIAELVGKRIEHWQGLADGTTEPGMSFGLSKLDRALGGGGKPGRLITIGGRPGEGKTSLATQILSYVGASAPCLFLSQEMTAGELIDRAVANMARVPLEVIASGQLRDDDAGRLADGADAASRLQVFIDDTPALSLLDIRAKARRVQQRHGLALLVLDYLQLSKPADAKNQSRHHQIEAISRGLKELAKELGITVIALSQLNRQSTMRADGEPTLADLKESGAIEEDSDTVILLHAREKLADGTMLVAAIIAKNRQGRRGRIALSFDGPTQRWVECDADVSPRAARK